MRPSYTSRRRIQAEPATNPSADPSLPVLLGTLSGPNRHYPGTRTIFVKCCFCGRVHVHGWNDGDSPTEPQWRMAHCAIDGPAPDYLILPDPSQGIRRLKRLALAARSRGTWKVSRFSPSYDGPEEYRDRWRAVTTEPTRVFHPDVDGPGVSPLAKLLHGTGVCGVVCDGVHREDAHFIANANPEAVLNLISEVESLRAQLLRDQFPTLDVRQCDPKPPSRGWESRCGPNDDGELSPGVAVLVLRAVGPGPAMAERLRRLLKSRHELGLQCEAADYPQADSLKAEVV